MNQRITNFVKHCDIYQKSKKPRQKKMTMPTKDQPFECLSHDTVGVFNYFIVTK